MDRNFHILYVSFEEGPEGRSYIGAHSTDNIYDGYLGSFVDKSFNPSNRIIIGYYKSRDVLLKAEEMFQKSFNVVSDNHYANQSIQHGSGFTYGFLGKSHTNEFRKALVEKNRKRVHTPEMRAAQSQRSLIWWGNLSEKSREEWAAQSSSQWKGVPKSESHKHKIGKAQLGDKNHRYGKKDSPETKEKKSIQSKGRRWVNNGEKEKMIKPGEPIPEGYCFGRKPKNS
jgi:hypothetical protein